MTAFSDGERITLGSPLCTLQKGCAQTSCTPVRLCAQGSPEALGLTDQFVWSSSSEGQGLALRARDRINVELARVQIPFDGFLTKLKPLELMSRQLAFEHNGGSSLPVTDGTEAWAQVWPHRGRIMSATEDWLIAAPSEFTLRFHKRTP